MDPRLLRTFQVEALRQCQHVRMANAQVRFETDPVQSWFFVECMIMAAANVSKIFYGAGSRQLEERRPIRESVNLGDQSVLRDLTVRNHFEHIDSRIQEWWDVSPDRKYIDYLSYGEPYKHFHAINVFRNIDLHAGKVTFWGDDVDLVAILAQIGELIPRLGEALKGLPPPYAPTQQSAQRPVAPNSRRCWEGMPAHFGVRDIPLFPKFLTQGGILCVKLCLPVLRLAHR